MIMAGISGRSFHTSESKFKFNEGSEFQNKEFSDGNGLDWYGTDFRGYDPQLGVFRQVDPLAESTDSWGVYSFGFNNPITFNDPLGLTPSSTGKFCESSRTQETSEPEPKWQVLPNVDVVAKVKSKSTLANSTFGWANQIQGSEISAWRNDLYGYQRLRDQGLSSSQAGARHQVNAADFERRYQAEQSWRFANYVLLDVLTSFLPLPKLSTARLARSLVATKIVRNPVVSSAAMTSTGLVDDAANFLSKGDYLRIQNAATRINKPITVVGSRAKGTAGAFSDWDYVIPGLNSKNWSTIKNSIPGARSVLDNTPRNIDIFKGPVNNNLPHITIYPR
jgi:RHS repeat-associated protein